MVKLSKLSMKECMYLNIINAISDKPTANTILIVKRRKFFSLDQK